MGPSDGEGCAGGMNAMDGLVMNNWWLSQLTVLLSITDGSIHE